jgi:surface protein
MKTLTIPIRFGYPTLDITVNGKEYTVKSGEEITVEDQVAEAIENAVALEPQPDAKAGKTSIQLLLESTNPPTCFKGNSKITSLDGIISYTDTRNVTSMADLFSGCSSLVKVPLLDTRNVTNMYNTFNGCSALTEIPSFDVRNVTNLFGAFSLCAALTYVRLRNISASVQVCSGSAWGHLIGLDNIIYLIRELRDTGSEKTLTVGSANLAKLASVYVKTIEVTDAMRAEDDLVVEKRPFVLCNSTEEGAKLITNYVAEKNWKLA